MAMPIGLQGDRSKSRRAVMQNAYLLTNDPRGKLSSLNIAKVRDLLAKQQNTKVELLTAEQLCLLKLPEELRAITELRSLALPLPGISKCFRLTLTKERGEGRTVVHGYTDWLVEVQQYHERECKHATCDAPRVANASACD